MRIHKTLAPLNPPEGGRLHSTFIIVSLIMVFYMPLYANFSPLVVEKYKVVTIVYWCAFFLLEAGVDIYLRYRVSKIDIYNSSIREIAAMAAQNWKIHKIGLFIGIPLAFGAIILFGLLLDADPFVIYCMIIGGIAGLIIGLKQLKNFYDNYRFLQTSESDE